MTDASGRRSVLKLMAAMSVALPRSAAAQEPRRLRPQTNDRFVLTTSKRQVTLADPSPGGRPVTAYPVDPGSGAARSGRRPATTRPAHEPGKLFLGVDRPKISMSQRQGTSGRSTRSPEKELWQFKTNSGSTGVPSSFAVDGKQYVAVQSGWGVDAQRMQARLDTFRGTKTEVPQGGVVWVFALSD